MLQVCCLWAVSLCDPGLSTAGMEALWGEPRDPTSVVAYSVLYINCVSSGKLLSLIDSECGNALHASRLLGGLKVTLYLSAWHLGWCPVNVNFTLTPGGDENAGPPLPVGDLWGHRSSCLGGRRHPASLLVSRKDGAWEAACAASCGASCGPWQRAHLPHVVLGEGDLLHSVGAHACVRVQAATQPTDLHLKGASVSPGCLLSSV